jgi:UDP-glucose 6-dehydrogenase
MKSDQHLDYANSLEEALRTCDCAIFLNESEEFKKLTNAEIVEYMKKPIVFDGKAVLNPFKLPDVQYYAIGKKK